MLERKYKDLSRNHTKLYYFNWITNGRCRRCLCVSVLRPCSQIQLRKIFLEMAIFDLCLWVVAI